MKNIVGFLFFVVMLAAPIIGYIYHSLASFIALFSIMLICCLTVNGYKIAYGYRTYGVGAAKKISIVSVIMMGLIVTALYFSGYGVYQLTE